MPNIDGIEYDKEQVEIPYDRFVYSKDNGWMLQVDERVIFFPSSVCEIDERSRKVWVPKWLAIKEELEDYIDE